MTRNAKCLAYILFLAVITFMAIAAAYLFLHRDTTAVKSRTSCLRAVHVLKSLGGPAATEQEAIPASVIYDDYTESLLHHTDKIMVLGLVAEDLAVCGRDYPKAALFEAYARLGLGEKETAARLLMRYVAMNPCNSEQYALLCRILYETEDATSLLLISREWAERDPGCRQERAKYIFIALFALGRFDDAEKVMREAETCMGWQAAPYAARAILAGGGERQAEILLDEGEKRYPDHADDIRRLWRRLQSRQQIWM